MGGRPSAAARHLRRRPAQRDDPDRHHARRDLRVPDGRQRRGGDRVRLAGHRQLCGHRADDQGFRPDPIVRAVRGVDVRQRQSCGRPDLRAGRSAHPPGLMTAPATMAQIARRRSAARSLWRRLRRNPVTLGALCTIAALLAAAALAPLIAPFDPDATDAAAALQSISWRHWLGTDVYGRDQLSRILFAARVDLFVPFAATAIALAIGSLTGAIAGYRGGILDQLVMRTVDAVLGFPALVLAMGLSAALGHSIGNLVAGLDRKSG